MTDLYKNFDKLHLDSLRKVVDDGKYIENDRTGVGTKKIFGHNERFDAKYGNFPMLTVRNMAPRIAFWELMWMLNGRTDVEFLQDRGIHIWDGNSTKEYLDSYGKVDVKPNTIGKGYGFQFRNFHGVDQLKNTFDSLKNDPYGRRHLISLWNPADFDQMALHPCHYAYVFDVDPPVLKRENDFVAEGDKKFKPTLNLHQHIRSNDAVLGSPYNKAFAVFFLNIMAKALGYNTGQVLTTITNFHIYLNHLPAVEKMLEVSELPRFGKVHEKECTINVRKIDSFEDMLSLDETGYELVVPKETTTSYGEEPYFIDPFLRFKKSELEMAV